MGEVIQHWNSRPIGVAMRIVHEIGDREVQHCSFEQKKRAELSGPEMNAMLNIQQSDVPIRGSVNSEWEEKKKKKKKARYRKELNEKALGKAIRAFRNTLSSTASRSAGFESEEIADQPDLR